MGPGLKSTSPANNKTRQPILLRTFFETFTGQTGLVSTQKLSALIEVLDEFYFIKKLEQVATMKHHSFSSFLLRGEIAPKSKSNKMNIVADN